MKLLSTLCLLLLASMAMALAEDQAKSSLTGPKGDTFDSFFNLTKDNATAEGAKRAASDFKNGTYRILIYGEPGPLFPSETYLQKNYGVEPCRIAGCKVTEGLVSGADAYNAAMRTLLNQKFGKDIFDEARLKTKTAP